MDRLIKVYDNVIDKEYCNHLIDKFENNEALHQKFDSDGMVSHKLIFKKLVGLMIIIFLQKVFKSECREV